MNAQTIKLLGMNGDLILQTPALMQPGVDFLDQLDGVVMVLSMSLMIIITISFLAACFLL